jgi:hypothetical protein
LAHRQIHDLCLGLTALVSVRQHPWPNPLAGTVPCQAGHWHAHTESLNDHSKNFFVGYQGGRTPTGWTHTAQSGKPDCRGPEAKPHQRHTPNTPIPGGAQCPDQNSMGVEPTHLLGVLQRLPAQRNHAHPTSSHWPPQ